MKAPPVPLTFIEPDREVTLVAVHGGRGLRRRLTDMGLNEGMSLRVVQAQATGPCVIAVGDTRLMLGHGMAKKIFVQPG